ncbi:ParB/RepB/Spo0J family partition protein (plasmid) [Deinococcus sp. KNUC1210]|uniref:ParB/RepB/Spo0J family partition protein n=1 Tax=Deinococcus sp. KNUC1210 TaxID=2917691 RepID=UPI001EF0554D|nr:ParB/RepB/Spo0J family partition protein [Deinococcus sp. KNUC1210]ULH18243.1 ParB/RepB/Spo0J family partition protein [Deinococcus sp. KNUC1210]
MTSKRPERKRNLAGLLEGSSDLTLPGQVVPRSVRLDALKPGSQQPRRTFGDSGLQELALSIQEHGVLQPLLVRPVDGGYEIVAGERRWRAAGLAGLLEVPVVIRELTDLQARAAALIENLQREDLNIIDEVDGKLDLVALALALPREQAKVRLTRLTKEEPGPEAQALEALFAPLGETWVTFAKNKLRILNWPPLLLDALRAGLPYTLAGVIVGTPEVHHAQLITLAQQGLSRSALRAEAERLNQSNKEGETSTAQAALVARRLSSRRFMARLQPDEKKAIERWLARMPDVLRTSSMQDD